MILHFGTRADEEWFCDKREEMINILVAQHLALENRALQVFGLSSPSLDDYLTSERDLARKISRMPGTEYLISRRSVTMSQAPQEVGEEMKEEEWVGDDDLIDDFVLLEPDFSKYNT